MKSKLITIVLGVAMSVAIPTHAGDIPASVATPDKVETSIGTLEYKDGAPSKQTVEKTYDYLDLMHGVEAFVNAYQGASVAANPDKQLSLPVHQIALVVNGVHLLENLKLDELAAKGVSEFALIVQPLKIEGGTGSTVAPVAVR